MGSLAVGHAMGFLVASQIGPLSLFLIRSTLGARLLRAVDGVAGSALVGFGGVLAWRTLHDG